MVLIIDILNFFLALLTYAVIARALLSWFMPNSHNQLVNILYKITDPILKPIQSFLPNIGMFDLSPVVAIFLIEILRNVVLNYFLSIVSSPM